MRRISRKFVLLGMLAVVAAALIATLAIPAMAATLGGRTRGAPGTPPNTNFATVQGTLTVSGSSVVVTPGPNPSIKLTSTGQTASIIYNSTTGAIQGLTLNKSGQPVPTPKSPPPAGIASVQGVVSVGSNNVVTVALNPAPSMQLTAPSNAKANIVYEKTTGAIQGLMSGRMGVPPMGMAPSARMPLNTNSANMQGALSLSGTSIIVTPSTAPSVSLTVTAGQTANILYNSTTKAVQGIMLTKSSQPVPTPGTPPAAAFASVQGAVTVTGNIITIIPANLTLGLTVPSNAKVTIVYDKTTGAIQGLMPSRMGMAPPGPRTPPITNSANLQGTLTVSSNVISVTPGAAPSVALTLTGTPNATIIYNSTTGAVQGLMLNKSGQPLPTPKTPPTTNFASVQGTVALVGTVITVTPNSPPSVALTAPSTAKVSIIYDKTSGGVQGLMLNRMGIFPFAPGGLPGQGGIKPNTTGPSGPSAPAVPHRQPAPGRMPMHSTT